MKTPWILVAAASFALSPIESCGQQSGGAQVQNGPRRGGGDAPAPIPAQGLDLKHFDLDFPGGTPRQLADAISEATGKHLNLIVPDAHVDTPIMPIKVEDVTVPQLFAAIQTASRREAPVAIGETNGRKSIQYRTVGVGFEFASQPVTDETVWSFTSTAPTKEDEAVLASGEGPDQVCQYFQLAPYLQEHTVEDITTAIQTGWKMLKVNPAPQLSFHEETKLLIAVGSAEHIAQIPQVLQQLQLDNSSAVEKIARLQEDLDEIETKKEGDWEKKAQEKREQIGQAARLQKARETIQNVPANQNRIRNIPPR